MDRDEPEHKLSLSTTQVVGSALAAMSVAFFTSWLGTAGTLIGAALGSIIATVGAAAYTWSLRRTSAVVRQTAAQVRQSSTLTRALPRTVAQGPLRKSSGELPDGEVATSSTIGDSPGGWRTLPWTKVLLASATVLVLCILGITAIEAVTGRSLASLSGHDDSSGTTLGNAVQTHPHRAAQRSRGKHRSRAPVPSDQASRTTPTQPGASTAPGQGAGQGATSTPAPTPPSAPQPSGVPSGAPGVGAGN